MAKEDTWNDLQQYLMDYPTSRVLLEKLVKYLKDKRIEKIETALVNEENYNSVNSYCSALDFTTGKLKTLIEIGKKAHDTKL